MNSLVLDSPYLLQKWLNEAEVWFQRGHLQNFIFILETSKNKNSVTAHVMKNIYNITCWAFCSHRHTRRAAPVPDGEQEGGQHVLHDLVHQLVLNGSETGDVLHAGLHRSIDEWWDETPSQLHESKVHRWWAASVSTTYPKNLLRWCSYLYNLLRTCPQVQHVWSPPHGHWRLLEMFYLVNEGL